MKIFGLALSFFLSVLALAAPSQNNHSTVYDVTPLFRFGNSANSLPQNGGKQIQFKSLITSTTKVLFEDLVPGANWRHPAKFKVVSAAGAVIEEVKTDLPPRHLERAMILSGVGRAGKVEFTLDTFAGKYRVSDPSKHYAFLLNGQADQRHWNDMSFLYRVLTQIYGFNPSNIIVADGAFRETSNDLDGNGTNDIKYGSSEADVKEAMKWFKDHLTEQDHLVLAVDDHGGTSSDGQSTIILQDVEMKATQFTAMLREIKLRKLVAIYEQCYSGGFVRSTVEEGRVAMAAATDSEFSWATRDLLFDEFIYHVIAAFAMQTHAGVPIASDLNTDGRISAQEAFAYAVGRDAAPESPLMEGSNNSGQAANFGIGF